MTDRHAGYVITLGRDTREDDAEATINALRMVKGVASVEPVVSTAEVQIARSSVKNELREKFLEFYRDVL